MANSTAIRSGEGIQVSVSMVNLITQYNQVSAGSNWPTASRNLTTTLGCGTLYYPMGIAIVSGHYSSGNISSSNSLYLSNPSLPSHCPNVPSQIDYYRFSPSTQIAEPGPSMGPIPMSGTIRLSGYWTGKPSVHNSGVFHYFNPGIYTILAGDEWGDMAILYFVVK
ncbi:MAG TPA: hypothetical protein VGR53_10925 [Nitrososphaerales archaeon]|nr:hypothetical protein [Nitrososphaerales archaeon]